MVIMKNHKAFAVINSKTEGVVTKHGEFLIFTTEKAATTAMERVIRFNPELTLEVVPFHMSLPWTMA